MRFTQGDVEKLAAEVRERTTLEDDELVTGVEIAVRLYGRESIVMIRTGAARLDGERLLIPQDHPDINFAVMHEAFHRECIALGIRFASIKEQERAANSFAAAILAPPQTMRRAYAIIGEHIKQLALVFGISQTSTVLRLGEVNATERAVVTATGNVLARGGRVRKLLEGGGPGLVKVRLRGGIDEGRTAVRVR